MLIEWQYSAIQFDWNRYWVYMLMAIAVLFENIVLGLLSEGKG